MGETRQFWELIRAFTLRLALFLPMLQILVPGVLAHSSGNDRLWCLSLASQQERDARGLPANSGSEGCLMCVVTAPGNSPLPSGLPPDIPVRGTLVISVPLLVTTWSADDCGCLIRPPIRAPPAVAALFRPLPVRI